MFTATNRGEGALVDYHDVWQKMNLVLVTLADDDPTAEAYAMSLSVLGPVIASQEVGFIVTSSHIEEVASPGVVVADRCGQVYYVSYSNRASELPGPR